MSNCSYSLIVANSRVSWQGLTVILFMVFSTLAAGKEKLELSREQIRKLQEQAETGDQGLKARKKLAGYYFSNKEYKKVAEYLSPVSGGLDRESLVWLATSYHQDKNYLNEIRIL